MLITLLALFPPFGFLLWWLSGGQKPPRRHERAPIEVAVQSELPPDGDTLTVLSFNIAWGYGVGSEGVGEPKPREHFMASAQKIGELARALGADVLLLQEIDFGSTRSRRVDQMTEIARHAGLRYAAAAPTWEARWVPFPYWPPRKHFGAVSSGGAVMSRWPITHNTIEVFEKPEGQAWWYNLFYVVRFVQRAELRTPRGSVVVLNAHLEGNDGENRQAQATRLATLLGAEGPHAILGADLNTVPPESSLRAAYPDEPDRDHRDDRTVEHLRAVIRDVSAPEAFRAAEREHFTFPADRPNRKLDYLFAGAGFEVIEARVVREAGPLSDHLPIVAKLRRIDRR